MDRAPAGIDECQLANDTFLHKAVQVDRLSFSVATETVLGCREEVITESLPCLGFTNDLIDEDSAD